MVLMESFTRFKSSIRDATIAHNDVILAYGEVKICSYDVLANAFNHSL
jgi:hypothetical protein